jgi:hypothetical protein
MTESKYLTLLLPNQIIDFSASILAQQSLRQGISQKFPWAIVRYYLVIEWPLSSAALSVGTSVK